MSCDVDANALVLVLVTERSHKQNNRLIEATISRLESYTHLADFGTCAVDWPLMDQWEEELARGALDFQ